MSALLPVALAAVAGGVLLLGGGSGRLDRVLRVPDPSEADRAVRAQEAGRPLTAAGRTAAGRGGAGLVSLGLVSLGLVSLVLSGPVAAGLTVVLGVCASRSWTTRHRRAARASERSRALEACAVLSTELRAGRDPAQALAAAAEVTATGVGTGPSPLARALDEATAAGRWGGDVAAALERSAPVSAAPELLVGLAACWRVCTDTGSGLADAVERLDEGLRVAMGQRNDVEAELAGPRATAVLLALLPLAGTALAAGLGARPVHVLLHTPLGAACLAVGVALDLLGIWWTTRLVVAAGGEP